MVITACRCGYHLQLSANMAATLVSFRWLDILEKEFDEAFVDLDILIGTHLCAYVPVDVS